jgi:hypothetical protein
MQAPTIPRVVAAAAAIAAAVGIVLLLASAPLEESPELLPREISAPADDVAPTQIAAVEPPATPDETPAAARARELEAMSETFRNTTLLIAIRDAGFVCNELMRVYGGIDTSAKWIATCSEMLAYTVTVAGTGTLHVEPTLQYFDGVLWAPPVDQGAAPAPMPRLDPRPLGPPQRTR